MKYSQFPCRLGSEVRSECNNNNKKKKYKKDKNVMDYTYQNKIFRSVECLAPN